MNPGDLPINELAKVCAVSGEAAEWEEFLRRCAPIASIVAVRTARMWIGSVTPSIVDDIVQEVFLKICEQERRILRNFEPRGEDSFLGLVRTVSASVANDYFRRQYSTKRGGKVVTIAIDENPGSEGISGSATSEEMQKTVLFSELDRRMRAAPQVVTERDRAVFWFYYRQGLTAEEIAALPAIGLSAKGVESALRRITTWLRKELEPRQPPRTVAAAQNPG
ncbi:MAG TPA: sigma-70 family RNA polymerase sigma factor [Terracidiphilus sp.]|nr:sigma-70 family RNA polymerase sigma factor [Terracidiphilus sp.]